MNIVEPIWSKPARELTSEDYTKFWEYISNSKLAYKYKIHYTTDAPLSIKSIIYSPNNHLEKYGMG